MQAYLQQYSLYPPFIAQRSRRHCDLFVVCRFESLIQFRKFLFRWSRVINTKFQVELIALFYEDEYGFDSNALNERTIRIETEKILDQRRFAFKVSPVFFGLKGESSSNKVMDLKILGDEVCFQALRRRYKKAFFLWTSSFSIPMPGLIQELMKLKRRVHFHAEKVHLPAISFEFSESEIDALRNRSIGVTPDNDNCPHLFFSTTAYIELYGKNPSSEKLKEITAVGSARLEKYLHLDTDYAY